MFDAAILDRPVDDRDPHAADILAPLLREAAANARGDFVSTARAMIRTQLAAGALSRENISRALGLSLRTLVYRLEALGLTYTGLADEAKFEAAQGMLRDGKTIAEMPPASASPSRAPSPAPSRLGPARRRQDGGPSGAGEERTRARRRGVPRFRIPR